MSRPKLPFQKGDKVRVTEGAFENCVGSVEGIDQVGRTVQVAIRIFDQIKRVKLDPWQIKKV